MFLRLFFVFVLRWRSRGGTTGKFFFFFPLLVVFFLRFAGWSLIGYNTSREDDRVQREVQYFTSTSTGTVGSSNWHSARSGSCKARPYPWEDWLEAYVETRRRKLITHLVRKGGTIIALFSLSLSLLSCWVERW